MSYKTKGYYPNGLPSWRRNIRHLPYAKVVPFCKGDCGSSPQ